MGKWLKSEIYKAKELLEKGLTYNQISENIERTPMAIRAKLKKEFNIKRTDFYSAYINKNCLNCNKEFNVTKGNDKKYNHKFCGNSCSATYNNKKRTNKIKNDKCLECNNNLNTGSKYCSNKCQTKFIQKTTLNKWLNNEISGNVKGGSFQLLLCIKNYIFDRANNKCEDCGENRINPYSNNSILTIDHIDGDASNNRPENLKVLCPSCHAMTPTYGNIGNRISARKKYRKKYRPSKK